MCLVIYVQYRSRMEGENSGTQSPLERVRQSCARILAKFSRRRKQKEEQETVPHSDAVYTLIVNRPDSPTLPSYVEPSQATNSVQTQTG
jgi:hypothetical protein